MGMYDQLRITRTLPDGFQSDDWYQTKSLECALTDYEIDPEGLLWEVGCCEAPDPGGRVRSRYSGDIVFYTFIEQAEAPHVWKEYRAVLVDGTLTHLEVADGRAGTRRS